MDPITKATRKESYEGILQKSAARCRLILNILGDKQMTVSEITEELINRGEVTYYNRNFAAPRLSELKKMGVVETVGRRRCTRSDKTEAVWARTKVAYHG